jgi:hypothetical protein
MNDDASFNRIFLLLVVLTALEAAIAYWGITCAWI